MEVKRQKNENKEEPEKNSDKTETTEKSEKDFFERMLETTEQDDDKKNIFIQYRIVNNHGIMASDSARIEKIYADSYDNEQEELKGKQKKVKRNIFSDENRRNKWLTENYEAYPMALMIAVAVFDGMPYMWVKQAADALYGDFEHKKDEEKKQFGFTETLSQFGAVICQGKLNTYTGVTPINIVRLDKKTSQETILKYIWIECPQLQDTVMLWLEKHYMRKPMSMSKRAGETLGQLACLDYHYFLNNMVNKIRHENSISTDMMIAQVVLALDERTEYQDNIYKLLSNWSKEHNVHCLLTGLIACAGQENKKDILENIISNYINRAMEEIEKGKLGEYFHNEGSFFASGMRAFSFYRILIEKIYELATASYSQRRVRNICQIFLRLFIVDTQMARYKEGEDSVFISLAVKNGNTGNQLRYLWQLVWQCAYYREDLYRLLAEYDKRARNMPFYNLEKFIQKTFGDVCDSERQIDICSKIRRRSSDE